MANYGKSDIEKWKFKYINLPPIWAGHLGHLWENFRMQIVGPSGHGKTEYVMMLAKMLSQCYGKVNMNSTEQGRHPSFQEAWFRNKMSEIPDGRFSLADEKQMKFEPWLERLKRPNSGKVVILDSIDYMNLKFEEYQRLHEAFKKRQMKSIITVGWSDPMATVTKQIRYTCDIKVEVNDYVAKIRGRAGGNKPFVIWDKKDRPVNEPISNGQLSLIQP